MKVRNWDLKSFSSKTLAILKEHWRTARILLAVLILSIIIIRIDPSRLIGAFHDANPKLFALAFVLLIPNLALQMLKWGYLVKIAEPQTPLRRIALSTFAGFSLGFASPGGMGEMMKGVYICRENSLKIVGLAALDKAFTTIALTLFFLFGLTLADSSFLRVAGLVGTGLLLVICCLVGSLGESLWKFFTRVRWYGIANLLSGLKVITWRRAFILVILSLFFCFVFCYQFYLLIDCFYPFKALSVLLAIPLIFLVKTFLPPLTPGGLGIREWAAVLVLSRFNVPAVYSFDAAFLLFSMNVLLPAVVGTCLISICNLPSTKPSTV